MASTSWSISESLHTKHCISENSDIFSSHNVFIKPIETRKRHRDQPNRKNKLDAITMEASGRKRVRKSSEKLPTFITTVYEMVRIYLNILYQDLVFFFFFGSSARKIPKIFHIFFFFFLNHFKIKINTVYH